MRNTRTPQSNHIGTSTPIQNIRPQTPKLKFAEKLFHQGLICSTVQDNYIQAHKWFNLATTLGFTPANLYRQEIARLMSDSDIAKAQKFARLWLQTEYNSYL